MKIRTDSQLLESYVRDGSEEAFRELVERRVNLVYSAALRQTSGCGAEAQEITQAVFIELARKGRKLLKHPALGAWLYTSVRHSAANLRRAEYRRQRREKESLTMNDTLNADSTDELWRQLRPELDDLMHELGDEERTAIVLRYFEGRGLKEVGAALGINENAARMRVDRALDKMRGLLSRRGVHSTVGTLASVLACCAVLSAPPAFASTLATGVLSAVAAPGTFGLAWFMSLRAMRSVLCAAGALLLTGLFVRHHFSASKSQNPGGGNDSVAAGAPTVAAVEIRQRERGAEPLPTGMMLRVVERETDAPLPFTKVHLFYMLADGRGEVFKRTTDENGKLEVNRVEQPFRGANMFVTADGHVPMVTSFGFGREMPAEYKMRLDRGVTVGGQIMDEKGRPVANAKIDFEGSIHTESAANTVQFTGDAATWSDSEGRWTCNMVPKELESIKVSVTHSGYAEATVKIHPDSSNAKSFVITLHPGYTVAGRVRDMEGRPISGAKLRQIRGQVDEGLVRTSDLSGSFEFENLNAGELILTVEAEGYSPLVRSVSFTKTIDDLQIELGPGHILRGRVVNENGEPIENAWVEASRGVNRLKWSTVTDTEGRFQWSSAPLEPLSYSFYAEGFNRQGAKLDADGIEHEIQLTTEREGEVIHISGTVSDADTGEPIDDFKVLYADIHPGRRNIFRFAVQGEKGSFRYTVLEGDHSDYQIQVQKEGYQPAVSETWSREAGDQDREFKLVKDQPLAGEVLFADGRPASEANVFLCTSQAGVRLDRPGHVEAGPLTTEHRTQTDSSGKFILPPSSNPQGIIVIHEQGYGEAAVPTAGKMERIVLQPWGRVEGTLTLGGQAVANERIAAHNQILRVDSGGWFEFMTLYFEARTDAQGRFSFEKVPPGDCQVFRQTLAPHGGFASHDKKITVNAGETTTVSLGGTGRPVAGRLAFPATTGTITWSDVSVRFTLNPPDSPRSVPRREDFTSDQAFGMAFESSLKAQHAEVRYSAMCEPDGSFVVQDVPAGRYELQVELYDFMLKENRLKYYAGNQKQIASISKVINIPETDQSNKDFDMGTITLSPKGGSNSAE